jgi:hypothetical protein
MNENEDELQFRLARAEDESDQRWEAREGTLRDRYNIYIDCLGDGEEPKTFDQWLNS